jgi:hypothetical protein
MCNENQKEGAQSTSKTSDLLDYTWKWFEYHAKQRVSMFNYFLVASGILANAYVHVFCSSCFRLAAVLALAGALIAGAFIFLDRRNAQLVYLAEDVLRKLEITVLFPRDFDGLSERGKETPRGILFRELSEKVYCWGKHKFLLKFIEILIAVCFFGAFIIAFWLDP